MKIDRKAFVDYVLGDDAALGSAPAAQKSPGGRSALAGLGFASRGESAAAPTADAKSFALRLLEGAGFGPAAHEDTTGLLLKDIKFLPPKAFHWSRADEAGREYQTLLLELGLPASALLKDSFVKRVDSLEDHLARLAQEVLSAFESAGPGRTAELKRGAQRETLCVLSILDDRPREDERVAEPRHLVLFTTWCVTTDALEVFTLREEARDWDRPLAEEHLGQLFDRHFSRLTAGEAWQDAFVSGLERKKAAALLKACERIGRQEKKIQRATSELLEAIAESFGLPPADNAARRRLEVHGPLPDDHRIAAEPEEARRKNFVNPFRGMRVFDTTERLLGYVVYVLEPGTSKKKLQDRFTKHNHFHNVLVIYPEDDGATLELWHGKHRAEGRLLKGKRKARFDGEGGIVQLLSKFFVVSRSLLDSSKDLARELAWRAQDLRELAREELETERRRPADKRPLRDLLDVFDQALASMTEETFADAYAQAITYGLLAARWMSSERGEVRFTRKNIDQLLPSTSPFLRDLFKRLVDSKFDKNLSWLLDDLTSLLSRTMVGDVFRGERDPAIHFYQDFLDAYDPRIRKEQGVYYTPDEVVSYIVRTAHTALQDDFGLSLGLADTTTWAAFARAKKMAVPEGVDPQEPFVQILDPALGTGTFLLRVIEVVHETMMSEYERRGLDEAAAREEWIAYVRSGLLLRLNGFELMMAPYIVSHLRLGLALQETGFVFEEGDRLRVFLTNTLEMHTPSQLSLIGEHVAEEAKDSEHVKNKAAISVVLGNPPYERESASTVNKGGWILARSDGGRAGIDDFDEKTRGFGLGGSIQATRNMYYYFWRWAVWRVFDRLPSAPGVVNLITASSFLRGPGFAGMRAHIREQCDRIDVLDLEGDQLGTRVTSNVFDITIPVCITTLRRAPNSPETGGAVRYQRLSGERAEKLDYCQRIVSLESVEWTTVVGSADGPLMSDGGGQYSGWPSVVDLFPLRFTGFHFYRTWPIAPEPKTLERRWSALTAAGTQEKPVLFKETRDRKINKTYSPLDGSSKREPSLSQLRRATKCPEPTRTSFRSLDRQWCLADSRVGDFLRPSLWRGWSAAQCYLTSLLSGVIGLGPGAMAAAYVPDCHHFRGSYGGKDVIPLWRDSDARVANVSTGLLAILKGVFGTAALPEDVFAYAYAVLANPGYVERFEEELQVPGPRLPVTKNEALFERGATLGREVLRWHTYGERFREKGDQFELVGSAKVITGIPGTEDHYPESHAYDDTQRTLRVGHGVVGPVDPEVYGFSVSGLQVVKSWLDYRMKKGAGRKSSPLDDIRPERWTDEMTRELLELLWVLEWTIAKYPELDTWLDEVLEGELFTAAEIPPPTDAERKEPKVVRGRQRNLEGLDD